ncbi:MAG TPA: metal-dependent hydrolase, partial [Candidatus Methanofastidiosa archaeon]|nr:metal-dependent hydrolase [Candidatus Methanofastidiosa archaeon]
SKDSVKKAISVSNRFLMETDYIDDISRPGAVMGPKTVPKRTNQFLENGVFSEEDVATIHEELVSELYGVEF